MTDQAKTADSVPSDRATLGLRFCFFAGKDFGSSVKEDPAPDAADAGDLTVEDGESIKNS